MAVAAASDNVRDHWHRYGDYDLLEVFGWAVKLAHLDTAPDAGCWAPMVKSMGRSRPEAKPKVLSSAVDGCCAVGTPCIFHAL